MFPINETELDLWVETEEESAKVGRSFCFDYDTKRFKVMDGGITECTGGEAVKQWIELLIRTIPGKYAIYNEKFGVATDEIIGYKNMPLGFIYSELKREIQEGIALNPSVDSMADYSARRDNGVLTISFMVHLKDGASEEVIVHV